MKEYKVDIKEISKSGGLVSIDIDIVLEEQLKELISNFLSADFNKREEILNNSK